MVTEDNLAQRLRLGQLFALYGGILTEKQQDCLRLYFYDDLSLGEISTELKVSRQAVFDFLKRAEQTLVATETKLHLLKRLEDDHCELQRAISLLEKADACPEALKILQTLSEKD